MTRSAFTNAYLDDTERRIYIPRPMQGPLARQSELAWRACCPCLVLSIAACRSEDQLITSLHPVHANSGNQLLYCTPRRPEGVPTLKYERAVSTLRFLELHMVG